MQAAAIATEGAETISIAGEHAVCDRSGALFFPALGLLVVSDLHLEKGSAFARRGAMVPPYDTAATLSRLAAVICTFRPATVVSLGDSFHDGWGAERMPDIFREEMLAMMPGRDGKHYLTSGWRIARPMVEWTRSDFYAHGGDLDDETAFRSKVLEQAQHFALDQQ